jgi:hypothetical protein
MICQESNYTLAPAEIPRLLAFDGAGRFLFHVLGGHLISDEYALKSLC